MIFGLTGGVAMGKSTVARTLQKHGVQIVDADIVARQVVAPGTPGLSAMVDAFGEEILLPDGTLNRAQMAQQVFNHPDVLLRKHLMVKLNTIMAPLIQQESVRQLNKLCDEGHALVCYDAALLFETGNADRYRPLIVVYCTPEQQIERLMRRGTGHGPLTREQAMNIIRAQMPAEEKAGLADRVIYTFGSMEESILQTEHCIEWLKRIRKTWSITTSTRLMVCK